MGYSFTNLTKQEITLKVIRVSEGGELPTPITEGEVGLKHLDAHEVVGGINIVKPTTPISCFGAKAFVNNLLISGKSIITINDREYSSEQFIWAFETITADGVVAVTNTRGTNYFDFKTTSEEDVRIKIAPDSEKSAIAIGFVEGSEVVNIGPNSFGDVYGFCLSPENNNFAIGTDTFSGDISVNVAGDELLDGLSLKINREEIVTFETIFDLMSYSEESGLRIDFENIQGNEAIKGILKIANVSGSPMFAVIKLPKESIVIADRLGLGTRITDAGLSETDVELSSIEMALSSGNVEPPTNYMWDRISNLVVTGDRFKITTNEQFNPHLTPDVQQGPGIDWTELGGLPISDDRHTIKFLPSTIEEYNAVSTFYHSDSHHIETELTGFDENNIPIIKIKPKVWDLYPAPYGNGEGDDFDRTDEFWFVNRSTRMIPVYLKTDLPQNYKTLLGSQLYDQRSYGLIRSDFGTDITAWDFSDYALQCGWKGFPGAGTPYFACMVLHENEVWFRAFIPSARKVEPLTLEISNGCDNGYVGFNDFGVEYAELGKFKFIVDGE